MLPSGNDAAHCLAEYFGGLLKKEAHEIEDREQKR
jgi:D-alanyl-D-alanine carboxypeptidase